MRQPQQPICVHDFLSAGDSRRHNSKVDRLVLENFLHYSLHTSPERQMLLRRRSTPGYPLFAWFQELTAHFLASLAGLLQSE